MTAEPAAQKTPTTDHDKTILADLIKAAMERGIDVPKIIATILKKGTK